MTPVFMTENLRDTGYAKGVGEDNKHLKLAVTQNGCGPVGAIGFNLGGKLPVVQNGKPFNAVFSLEENHWNGIVSLQLKFKDLR